jgi:hypothetical protein
MKKQSKGLGDTQQVTSQQQRDLLKVSNRVFNRRDQVTSCSSCLRDLVGKIRTVYNEYKDEEKDETITKQ